MHLIGMSGSSFLKEPRRFLMKETPTSSMQLPSASRGKTTPSATYSACNCIGLRMFCLLDTSFLTLFSTKLLSGFILLASPHQCRHTIRLKMIWTKNLII